MAWQSKRSNSNGNKTSDAYWSFVVMVAMVVMVLVVLMAMAP